MSSEAPEAVKDDVWTLKGTLIGNSENVSIVVIPKEEWDAHKARVEAMVNLINGVINGLAANPLFMSMVPPDVLSQMQGKL